jgi:hypothetical protein
LDQLLPASPQEGDEVIRHFSPIGLKAPEVEDKTKAPHMFQLMFNALSKRCSDYRRENVLLRQNRTHGRQFYRPPLSLIQDVDAHLQVVTTIPIEIPPLLMDPPPKSVPPVPVIERPRPANDFGVSPEEAKLLDIEPKADGLTETMYRWMAWEIWITRIQKKGLNPAQINYNVQLKRLTRFLRELAEFVIEEKEIQAKIGEA